MRRARLGVLALLVATTLGVSLGAQPAAATEPPAAASPVATAQAGGQEFGAQGIQDVIDVLKRAYSLYKRFAGGGDGLSLAEATQQIIAAIESAKAEILSHIDRLAAAQGRACATSAVIDFEDITRFTTDTLQDYARDSTACVTLISSSLAAVTDKGAVDQLGFALNSVGPIALIARHRAGFSTSGLRSELVRANGRVVSKLAPSCHATVLWGDMPVGSTRYEVVLTCRAYNGDIGRRHIMANLRRGSPLPQFDYTVPAEQACRNTSRPVAQAARAAL